MQKIEEGYYVTAEQFAHSKGVSAATAKRWCAKNQDGDNVFRIGRMWLIRVAPPASSAEGNSS